MNNNNQTNSQFIDAIIGILINKGVDLEEANIRINTAYDKAWYLLGNDMNLKRAKNKILEIVSVTPVELYTYLQQKENEKMNINNNFDNAIIATLTNKGMKLEEAKSLLEKAYENAMVLLDNEEYLEVVRHKVLETVGVTQEDIEKYSNPLFELKPLSVPKHDIYSFINNETILPEWVRDTINNSYDLIDCAWSQIVNFSLYNEYCANKTKEQQEYIDNWIQNMDSDVIETIDDLFNSECMILIDKMDMKDDPELDAKIVKKWLVEDYCVVKAVKSTMDKLNRESDKISDFFQWISDEMNESGLLSQ